MQLAMYKGPPDDFWHTVGHTGTCVWTRSKYSHCELVFSDPVLNSRRLCASSSARDGGVRFKRIDLGSGRWDLYQPARRYRAMEPQARQWFIEHEGLPYDHLGLAWFVLPIDAFNHPARLHCSEAVAAALGMRKPHRLHPQRLLDAVVKD